MYYQAKINTGDTTNIYANTRPTLDYATTVLQKHGILDSDEFIVFLEPIEQELVFTPVTFKANRNRCANCNARVRPRYNYCPFCGGEL